MFDSYLPSFVHYLRFEKRYSPHTIESYEGDLVQFRDYLSNHYPEIDSFRDISHHIIRSWLADAKTEDKLSAATLNRRRASLSSFFRHLMRAGVIDANPVKHLHGQRMPERLPQFIRENEASYLLEEHSFGEGFKGATDRLICELLYNTGMRRQELVALKETDVEWSLRQLRVLGKGNKERLIPLSEALLEAIKIYIAAKPEAEAGQHNLLVLESGKPLYPGYVYRVVQKHLAQTTTVQKKSPHVMRHTFATHLLNNGANIQAIKDLLGHSSLAATQVYTHNSIAKLKEIHKAAHPRG